MGEVISSGAGIERIKTDVLKAYTNAQARPGQVKGACDTILGPAVQDIQDAAAALEAATKVVNLTLTHLAAIDAKSDLGIGRVRDEIWNALERPQSHPAMTHAFPDGIKTYTAGDPRHQPLLMQVLEGRLLSMPAPAIPKESRDGWVAEVETLRLPHHDAAEAVKKAEAIETVAESAYKGFTRTGLVKLSAFKREMKNLGMTEAQIHEIIPDAGAGTPGKGKGGKGDEGAQKGEKEG